ncbi:hypothetical protein ACH5RR_008760 [Cinchona calisaya]|uniref:Uncharacterized protein n=1 Tax=Cinchona calisaya TaxID=153742 RepID=A0ABD3AD08_9GENT
MENKAGKAHITSRARSATMTSRTMEPTSSRKSQSWLLLSNHLKRDDGSVHPFNMASWPTEPEPPTWHFKPDDLKIDTDEDYGEEGDNQGGNNGAGPSETA